MHFSVPPVPAIDDGSQSSGSGSVNQREPGSSPPHAAVIGAIATILRRTRPGNSVDYFLAAGKFPMTSDAIAPDFFRPEPV
jgi:hypothetical protein